MKISGAGWVENETYGAVRKSICGNYIRRSDLYRSLLERKILAESTSKFGRFNRSTQQAFCAAALALHDADFPPSTPLRTGQTSKDWKHVGLIGTGQDECTPANQAYFADYAENGRRMARANLFIYTLPTSSLAEIAIHFKLDGPLFYTSEHVLPAANRLLGDDPSHVLAFWSEKSFTAALLLSSEEAMDLERFHAFEKPEQLIRFLTAEGCG